MSMIKKEIIDGILDECPEQHRAEFKELIYSGKASKEFLTLLNNDNNLGNLFGKFIDLEAREFRQSMIASSEQAEKQARKSLLVTGFVFFLFILIMILLRIS